MKMSAHSSRVIHGKQQRSLIIRTTLYNLVAAISAEVRANEEDLMTAAVVHLLKTRLVTHHGIRQHGRLVVHRRRDSRHCRRGAATTAPQPPETIAG
jgi:hypothetical protein